jgi:regulatory protein, lysR:lysR, substrate-binding
VRKQQRRYFRTFLLSKLPEMQGLLRLEHLPLIGLLAPVVLACAWSGRRLAARIPLRVFEPLVIATTIVATVPLLVERVVGESLSPRRQLSPSGVSMRWARTRWKQCELVVEL